MAAQDPLGAYTSQDSLTTYSPVHQHHAHPSSGQPQHPLHLHHASSSTSYLPSSSPAQQQQPATPQDGGIMFGAPDWSAFQPAAGNTPAPAPMEPLDPLEPLPQTTDHYAYRAPPGSGPVSEVGDGDYGDQSYPVHHSPTVMHHHAMMKHPMHPPPPPSAPVRQMQGHRGPPIQLSLNMQYGHSHSAGPYSGYTPSSTTSPITADIADQMNQFSMAQHGSPMKATMGGMDAVASSPAMYHHGHMHSQSMEHLPHHQHVHMHSHSHSQTMIDAFHESQPQQQQQQQQHTDHQWPDWTNADPFHTDTGNSGGVGNGSDHAGVGSNAASLDPISPLIGHTHGVGAIADAYRI